MPATAQIKVPLVGVNDTHLTVVSIPFQQGDAVKKGDLVLVLETSKTTYDVIAEADGFIGYLCETEGEYEVNELVAIIYSESAEVPATPIRKSYRAFDMTAGTGIQADEAAGTWQGDTLFSPAAIKLMLAHDMSRELFRGRDFVSRTDVEQRLTSGEARGINSPDTYRRPPASLLPIDEEKITLQPLSGGKKREIAYLAAVQAAGLTSTIHTAVETGGIFVYINESLQFLKDSLLPVLTYETARLLQQYPLLNGYFTGDAVALYQEVNIGFAMDAGKGLKVLRIAGAAAKGIKDIEQDILDLSNKYLGDTLTVEDLSGISFTITDLSAEGVTFFTPLVNRMNSAILGVSSIDRKLERCILSVSFDHRVTEGKTVAQFLNALKERLESYRSKHYPHLNRDISCFKCFKQLKDDLSDVGFSRCITPLGNEAYICQSCLKGF